MWLFALIAGLPLIEIALFVVIGGWIGLWPTLAIVIGTAIAGVALIRRQGARATKELQAAISARRDPTMLIAGDAMKVAAGILLVLPGFLTDTLGLLLLVPPIRLAVIAALGRGARRKMDQMAASGSFTMSTSSGQDPWGGQARSNGVVIDGTWEELPPQDNPPPSGWTRH
jgi:UPF0716 protein FxsA